MIDKLNYLYKSIDIYRAIIIIDNYTNDLIKDLENNDYQPLIIKKKEDIDYNYRLFIINDINLLQDFNKNNYNLIIFI